MKKDTTTEKFPTKRWKTIKEQGAPDYYQTTAMVSSEYRGFVTYNRHTRRYNYRIIKLGDKAGWTNPKEPFKSLATAKRNCWLGIMSLPHKEVEETEEIKSFGIRWDDVTSQYKVTIPNYEGGEVVPIERYNALLESHNQAITALKDVQSRIEKSDEWWMDSKDRGGFDTDIIDNAIDNGKKYESIK